MMKQIQTTLQDRFQFMDSWKALLDYGLISLHDYWLLTENYRVIRQEAKE
jgi:hypothetical protein